MAELTRDVTVVIGIGGMGEVIARRQGAGRSLVIADFNQAALEACAGRLRDEGFAVTAQQVDVGNADSVTALADTAAGLGPVRQVVHTAGVSPALADLAAVLRVDLLGTALVLDAFGAVIAPGGAGVVIASMAGHMIPLPADQERALGTAPSAELLDLDFIKAIDNPLASYPIAKRGNQLRIRAAAKAWGQRGARVNSVSPGVISTAMGQAELASETGEGVKAMIAMSATERIGTPTDVADAVAFLLGPNASFITGTDLLVDGGVIAAMSTA